MDAILFTNAAVFDGVGDALAPGRSVLVADGLIQEVSDKTLKAPDGAEVVDLGGRTLMPGLIDAHVHIWATDLDIVKLITRRTEYLAAFAYRSLAAMLDRGFTTVRDAGGTDVGYVQALQDGLAKGPRLLHAGRVLTQTGGHGDFRRPGEFSCACELREGGATRFAHVVDSPDEVRKAVREELRHGAHQIKIMGSGGVASPSDPVDRLQFSDGEILAAVEEAERHGAYVMAHCHPAEAVRRCAELGVRSIEHATLIDQTAADAVAAKGAFVVPTLATIWALLEDGAKLGLPPVSQEKLRQVSGGVLQGLQVMRRSNLKVGFGTDLLGSQQDRQGTEFALRAQVFEPVEILRQATSINAELLQMPDRIGRVAPGFVADLIVVDGDPLADVSILGQGGANLPVILQGGRFHKRTL
ncbi:metal-dependent hydrolase family protein [Phenylobacterium sp.]|jgi:imidazolonepropionase-like amidohydrolase|uniref:metal-dependent hydrolase family protein n=1 Tax=Phenylobacterium sp. TaxID=1871053 RepID=UPI002F3EBBFF